MTWKDFSKEALAAKVVSPREGERIFLARKNGDPLASFSLDHAQDKAGWAEDIQRRLAIRAAAARSMLHAVSSAAPKQTPEK